ncbi:single-stranded DNA-binding protein [Lewinella sp. IMCC34183]|uniref:single-stranded DNA-binding protein n=1 Tax=Lewinella sp. IMCC34183 TaxID=2248762 RepID=UPI000E24D031|nr:single-stranded DNA-binding protein [Lewinella sp. IMCC34183]
MQVRNSVTLIGNVGQLPTVKTLPSGSRLIEFSFATNDSYRNKEGDKVTRTEWHRVKAYGKVVDVLERYLRKGTALAISGTIRYGKWTDQHGQNRTSTDIILSEFTFTGNRNEAGGYPTADEAEVNEPVPQAAEPAPKKTRKRRTKAATPALTPAEDLPF